MNSSLTNFPNGITSFGIPIFGGNNRLQSSGYGNTWFVKAIDDGPDAGLDGNSGSSPDNAFRTMSRAFEALSSGDTINFIGNITEQPETPAGIFDVTINGAANTPRNADGGFDNGSSRTGATWRAPGSPAASPLLLVNQQGWALNNFLMNPPSVGQACVSLNRNALADDLERDASHLSIAGMRFAGTGLGILDACGCFSVSLIGNTFQALTSAITNSATPVAVPLMWSIKGNRFQQNTNDIRGSFSYAEIQGNTFHGLSTVVINTVFVAAQGGNNVITWNAFNNTEAQIAPTNFVGAASDMWSGNLVSNQAAYAFGQPA